MHPRAPVTARRRDMTPTPAHVRVIERMVTATAASYQRRLSPQCVEDLTQEVFLRLWRHQAEAKLDHLPYVRRVAKSVTVDLLRREGAQKRRPRRGVLLPASMLRYSCRTPEDILLAREEARLCLAKDFSLRWRVWHAMPRAAFDRRPSDARSANA